MQCSQLNPLTTDLPPLLRLQARQKIGFLYYVISNGSASNCALAVSLEPLEKRGLISSETRVERVSVPQ